MIHLSMQLSSHSLRCDATPDSRRRRGTSCFERSNLAPTRCGAPFRKGDVHIQACHDYFLRNQCPCPVVIRVFLKSLLPLPNIIFSSERRTPSPSMRVAMPVPPAKGRFPPSPPPSLLETSQTPPPTLPKRVPSPPLPSLKRPRIKTASPLPWTTARRDGEGASGQAGGRAASVVYGRDARGGTKVVATDGKVSLLGCVQGRQSTDCLPFKGGGLPRPHPGQRRGRAAGQLHCDAALRCRRDSFSEVLEFADLESLI